VAVVADEDLIDPRAAQGDLEPAGFGVERVFGEFLDRGRGPLDHLPGGDLVDQVGRQDTDARRLDGHHTGGAWHGSAANGPAGRPGETRVEEWKVEG